MSERKEGQIAKMRPELKDLELKRAKVDADLKLHGELVTLGFDKPSLKSLKAASDKYGGPKAVLKAVNGYVSMVNLTNEAIAIAKEASDARSELKKYQADHAHLQTIMDMCETLLYKRKYSLDAITGIYELAGNYGEPIVAIRTLNEFGKLKAIQRDIGELSSQKAELELAAKGLNDQVRGLRAQSKQLGLTLADQLGPISKEMKEGADQLKAKATAAIDDIAASHEEATLALKQEQERALKGVVQTADGMKGRLEKTVQDTTSSFEQLLARSM